MFNVIAHNYIYISLKQVPYKHVQKYCERMFYGKFT